MNQKYVKCIICTPIILHNTIHTIAAIQPLSRFARVSARLVTSILISFFCHNPKHHSLFGLQWVHSEAPKYLCVIYTGLHTPSAFRIEELGPELDLNLTKVNLLTRHSNCAEEKHDQNGSCLLYTSPSPRDSLRSRMPSSA